MPYENLILPEPPDHRPFVFLNMVCTLDGKIVTGGRDEPVMDLGSATDHATMRHLESLADAVLIGAGSLRATPALWYPEHLTRIVASQSGDIPWESRFFSDIPEKALWFQVGAATGHAPSRQRPEGRGAFPVLSLAFEQWAEALQWLRKERGIERLLVEGGSELNAELLCEGLIDEIFLTLAPKLKLGRSTPTLAGGDPFERESVETWSLISADRVDHELFLRYARWSG